MNRHKKQTTKHQIFNSLNRFANQREFMMKNKMIPSDLGRYQSLQKIRQTLQHYANKETKVFCGAILQIEKEIKNLLPGEKSRYKGAEQMIQALLQTCREQSTKI